MLATMPLAAAVGALSIGWLVIVVAINGALSVAFELAQSAWIARSTAHEQLTQRNSVLAGGVAVTEAASFGLTGWLFQWLGAIVVMVAHAFTYVVSALLLTKVTEPPPLAVKAAATSTLRERVGDLVAEVRAGLAAVAADAVLRALSVVATLVALASSFAATTYMIYVSRDVGFSPGVLGLLFALGDIGSLVGSWLTGRVGRIDPRSWLVASLLIWSLGTLATPLATTTALAGALLIATVGDAGAISYYIADRTLRQTHAPPQLLARVDASVRTLGYGATLIGAFVSGVLAEQFGRAACSSRRRPSSQWPRLRRGWASDA